MNRLFILCLNIVFLLGFAVTLWFTEPRLLPDVAAYATVFIAGLAASLFIHWLVGIREGLSARIYGLFMVLALFGLFAVIGHFGWGLAAAVQTAVSLFALRPRPATSYPVRNPGERYRKRAY